MLNPYYVVQTIFRNQTFPEYYGILDGFADALDKHELYNALRPQGVPTGDTFRQHKAVMKELGIGADRGDALLKEKRQIERDVSELHMDAAVSFARVLAIGKKDPTILHNLSLPLKDSHPKLSRKGPAPHAIEIHLELKRLRSESGAIVVMGSHVRGGGPYLLNICKGEPVSEESWYNPGGHYSSCRRIELRGLEPASKYYVRMKTDRPDGQGDWSQPVSIIVL